jgi:hypothetical protein
MAIQFWAELPASLRAWLAGPSADRDASAVAVLGCTYLLLINLVDIFDYAHQALPLIVANGARALIMLLLLALLPAGQRLGPRLGHPRRWMFVMSAVLAAAESARSIGSIYRTHIVAGAVIACIALTFAVDFPDRTTARRARWFCVAVFLSVFVAHAALKPKAFDIGYTSIGAIRAISMGFNPYKVDLDTFDYAVGNTNEARFTGYKYSPLLPIFYFPGVILFGDFGILVSNTMVLGATALTIAALCRRNLSGGGLWAAVLLLATPLVGMNVLVYQVNDLVAVLPVCVAFLVWEKHPGLAGLVLGASASVKIMPAPIAMALLLPLSLSRAGRFVTGIIVGLIPIMVFAAMDPPAFFNNVVLFHVVRPSSPASLLSDMPPTILLLVRLGFMAAFLFTTAAALIRSWSIECRMLAYLVLTIFLLLTSQTNFDNYWLWWIPIFLPLLCAGWDRALRRPACGQGGFR